MPALTNSTLQALHMKLSPSWAKGLEKRSRFSICPQGHQDSRREGLPSMARPRSGELKSISVIFATHRPFSPSRQTLRLNAPFSRQRCVGLASLNLILGLQRLGFRSLARFSRRALIDRASDYVEVPFLTLLLHTLCAFLHLHQAAVVVSVPLPKLPLQARLHAPGAATQGRDPTNLQAWGLSARELLEDRTRWLLRVRRL